MATVKTAISMEQSLFDKVNDLAEALQLPRSQVVAAAVEEYIERHRNRRMLATLNEVYADGPDPSDEILREGLRRQHRQLLAGQW